MAAILPASDDAALPACCRRNGAHHCAMYMQMAARMASTPDSAPVFRVPSHCPYYPLHPGSWTMPPLALVVSPIGLPALLAQPHSPAAGRAAARLSQIRTRAGRGPPSTASI